ncbi:MAG: Uma2 family endonuclease [Blastocatellia bacterium]|nr:Uma2 family endonuclease [Blastocatellia bacterium]
MGALTQSPPIIDEAEYYPESDGVPMADNTKQFEWIVTIKEGLDALLPHDFVAGDLLWYPVRGQVKTWVAPDVLVALGRPKGHRGSYKQWEEEGVAPQVVFEILSPGNTVREMIDKEAFYERHGVAEYYIYDPDTNTIWGWLRETERLVKIPVMADWVSPRLGIRFERTPETLIIHRPDGRCFLTYQELEAQHQIALAQVEAERERAEVERQAKEAAQQENERLKEKLRALGIDPEQM